MRVLGGYLVSRGLIHDDSGSPFSDTLPNSTILPPSVKIVNWFLALIPASIEQRLDAIENFLNCERALFIFGEKLSSLIGV